MIMNSIWTKQNTNDKIKILEKLQVTKAAELQRVTGKTAVRKTNIKWHVRDGEYIFETNYIPYRMLKTGKLSKKKVN